MSAIFQAYRQAYAGLPREVWLLSLVIFVNRCGTMVLPFLALYLSEERGFTPAQAGKLLAVYGCGAIVGTYLGGQLTQRWGGVRVACVSFALSVPAFLTIPAYSSPTGIALGLVLLSIVYEAIRPAIATATSDACPPELLPKAFAVNRLAMNLGMSVGPAVGGFLATIDYRYLFWINGAFAALTALSLVRLIGVLHRSEVRAGSDGSRSSANSQTAGPAQPRGPWQDGHFMAYIALQVVTGIVFFQVMSTLPLHWKQQGGINEFWIGVLFVINTALIVLLEMVLTDRLRLFAPLKLVAIGNGLVCLGFGATVLGDSFTLACVLVVVWTFGEMLLAPFGMAYVAGRSAGRARGAYMGLNSMSYAVAFVLGPMVGTLLYDIDPSLPWWCCLALAVLLPIGFWRLAASDRGALAGRPAVGIAPAAPLKPRRQIAEPRQDDQRVVEPAHAGDVMKELPDKYLPGEPNPSQQRRGDGTASNSPRH